MLLSCKFIKLIIREENEMWGLFTFLIFRYHFLSMQVFYYNVSLIFISNPTGFCVRYFSSSSCKICVVEWKLSCVWSKRSRIGNTYLWQMREFVLLVIVIYLWMRTQNERFFVTGERSMVHIDVCVNILSTSILLS